MTVVLFWANARRKVSSAVTSMNGQNGSVFRVSGWMLFFATATFVIIYRIAIGLDGLGFAQGAG
jgi:hypothetical protein